MGEKRMKLFTVFISISIIVAAFSVFIGDVVIKAETNSPQDVNDDWPMFQHDPKHTGWSKSKVSKKFTVKWVCKTDDYIVTSAVVSNGMVFVGSRGGTSIPGISIFKVYSIDELNGHFVWISDDYYTTHICLECPTVFDNKLFFGLEDKIFVLDISTGGQLWNYTVGNFIQSPLTIENGIIFYGTNNSVGAVDISNRTTLWNYAVKNGTKSSPAVTDELVIGASIDGDIFSLNKNNGSLIWEYSTEHPIYSSPTIANGIVIIGASQIYSPENRVGYGMIIALDEINGTILWNHSLPLTSGSHHEVLYSSPAVADNMVFIGTIGAIYALDLSDGHEIWYFLTKGYLDPTFAWYGCKISAPSSPAVADGIVFVGSSDHHLYVIDEFSGKKIWEYVVDWRFSQWRFSPAVANGMVFMGSMAFGVSDGEFLFIGIVIGISIGVIATVLLVRKRYKK